MAVNYVLIPDFHCHKKCSFSTKTGQHGVHCLQKKFTVSSKCYFFSNKIYHIILVNPLNSSCGKFSLNVGYFNGKAIFYVKFMFLVFFKEIIMIKKKNFHKSYILMWGILNLSLSLWESPLNVGGLTGMPYL